MYIPVTQYYTLYYRFCKIYILSMFCSGNSAIPYRVHPNPGR